MHDLCIDWNDVNEFEKWFAERHMGMSFFDEDVEEKPK